MKAVLQYRATPGFRAAVAALEDEWLRISVVDESDKQAFAREMHDADVLLHVLERVTQSTIELAPRLKLIQKLGVGVDTIDLEAARARGHRRVQHAGSKYARRGGAYVTTDAGDAPAAVRARQTDTRGKRMGARFPASR